MITNLINATIMNPDFLSIHLLAAKIDSKVLETMNTVVNWIVILAVVYGLGKGTYRLATGDQEGKKDFLLILIGAAIWLGKATFLTLFGA